MMILAICMQGFSNLSIPNITGVAIFIIALYDLMQYSVYILFCQKEFMNKRTYVICTITLMAWMVFTTISTLSFSFMDKKTTEDQVKAVFSIAYLGITSMLIKTIMEFMKNTYVMWKADQIPKIESKKS